ERAEKLAALGKAVGGPVMAMSGVSREGLTEVLRELRARIGERARILATAGEEPETWRP
ncbi:MAG: GTPase ObgE, partial [Rhodobacteraceae bacterium]|nr:GTPase ObgE [Paracoccaceae bacterium]